MTTKNMEKSKQIREEMPEWLSTKEINLWI